MENLQGASSGFIAISSPVATKKIDDVISGYSIETNHKIKNISGNDSLRKQPTFREVAT